jgi:uncharacterized protein YfaS (alpha-2-macroglobulin family)
MRKNTDVYVFTPRPVYRASDAGILIPLDRKQINHLTPNGHFSGRTAPLTYRCCIFFI